MDDENAFIDDERYEADPEIDPEEACRELESEDPDDKAVQDVMDKVVNHAGSIMNYALQYSSGELPFVVTGIYLAANMLNSILPDAGRELVSIILQNTQSTVINCSELMRQMEEEDDDAPG